MIIDLHKVYGPLCLEASKFSLMSVHSLMFLESEWTTKGWSAKASTLVYLGSLYCRGKVEILK